MTTARGLLLLALLTLSGCGPLPPSRHDRDDATVYTSNTTPSWVILAVVHVVLAAALVGILWVNRAHPDARKRWLKSFVKHAWFGYTVFVLVSVWYIVWPGTVATLASDRFSSHGTNVRFDELEEVLRVREDKKDRLLFLFKQESENPISCVSVPEDTLSPAIVDDLITRASSAGLRVRPSL